MPERESRLPYLILPLAALIAVYPLLFHGCSCGHDFDFHILSWFEAARQFAHGNLHPHWAYTPAYNAGEPRFVFYPPISWTIGAILGLILPWTWAPIIYTWLALTSAGLSLYYLAREFAPSHAALLAASFYLVNPYTLFTAYERTAYAELLAAAWIPLLLHAILRSDDKGGVTIPRIAIPVALLWLTDAPAAVMSCYALALIAIIRLIQTAPKSNHPDASQSRTSLALNTSAGTLLGLSLAAFYILPAAYERRYVHIAMAIIPGMRIQDNFLFHHMADPDHDLVLHTVSIIAVILIALTVAALIAAKRATETRISSALLFTLAALTLTIAFLLTPLSVPLWNHLPELLFLQFPWRLLAILAAVLCVAIAIALASLKIKATPAIILALAIAATLTAIAYRLFQQPCDTTDTVAASLALFRSNAGTDPTDEYTPVTADNDSLAPNNPPYWLALNPDAKAPSNSTPGPAPTHLTIATPIPQTLILNLRDYPAWRITRNGEPVAAREQRDDGLIAIPLPTGQSQIAIKESQPLDRTVGDILSVIAIILLLFLLT